MTLLIAVVLVFGVAFALLERSARREEAQVEQDCNERIAASDALLRTRTRERVGGVRKADRDEHRARAALYPERTHHA